MKRTIRKILTLAVTASVMIMPLTASAQTELQRRNQTQNEWRTIATVSGAAALLGLLKKDNTLAFAGTAGALYSLYRYDEDSKSKDRLSRARAAYFSKSEFYRDGIRYNRRVVTKSGKKYYQFYKAPKNQQDWKSQGLHDNRNNSNSNRNHDKHGNKKHVPPVNHGKSQKRGRSDGKSQGNWKSQGKGKSKSNGRGGN